MSTEGSKREGKLEKGLAKEGPGRGSPREGSGRGWAQGREDGPGWAVKGGLRKGVWARKGKGPTRRADLGGRGPRSGMGRREGAARERQGSGWEHNGYTKGPFI